MGQKVNPHGLRVGVIKDWDSKWIAGKKDFGDQLVEDYNIRSSLRRLAMMQVLLRSVLKESRIKCLSQFMLLSLVSSSVEAVLKSIAKGSNRKAYFKDC